MKKEKQEKHFYRERLADWMVSPKGRLRSKIKPESRQEIRSAILNPIAWFKGADLPEGHITPWELFLFALSSGLTLIASGFSGKQDFLFKEYYHISPNMLTVGGVISSIWDAANDPFLGSWMDRKRMGPVQWRRIMRISAVTGHCLNVIKMLDGGMSAWQHVALLVFCNCVQDVIGTLDSVAGQKLRAGISPYSQQRARTQVWTSVGNTIAYPLSTLPLLLMGLKDVLHFNDYQIIVMGTLIMLPFNIIASYMITFIRQRVTFRPGAPLNSLAVNPENTVEVAAAEAEPLSQEDRQAMDEMLKEENIKLRAEKERLARKNMLKNMTAAERRAFKKQEKNQHKENFKNGIYEIDPITGEPKLSVLESFAIVRHNKYFITNTVANFITVFTPSVDPLLIYRYLVPRLNVFGKELSGEMMWLLHAQIAGSLVTLTKPFSRQMVNFVGGPLRAHRIAHASKIVSFIIRFFLGCKSFPSLIAIMLLEAVQYIIDDADAIAGTMLNYEMLDYVELKTGLRSEGVTMSVNALFSKIVTNNIGSATGNAFLQWTGYTGGYQDGDKMPERFEKYMWPMYTLSTVVDSLIWLIARCSFKYSPEDRERVEAALQERRAAAEQAEPVRVAAAETAEE